jgi:chromosome segregation ATPase
MPDQTPAPFSDEELAEFASGLRASNPRAAVEDLATELVAARARIAELEAESPPRFSQRQFMQAIRDRDEAQARAAELADRTAELMSEAQADHRAIEEARDERDKAVAKRDERVDYDGRLAYLGDMSRRLLDEKTEACQWAAWFAAERDYVNRHRNEELAINRAYMDRMAVDMDAKDARITELEAGLDESRADAGRAHGNAGALHARVMELLAQVTARDARIAELEAAQTPREPDAYIAVQRYHSPNAEGPEWFDRAVVFPASDPYEIRDGLEQHGYEFLPIMGTETGTRYAAAPQSDPVVRDA